MSKCFGNIIYFLQGYFLKFYNAKHFMVHKIVAYLLNGIVSFEDLQYEQDITNTHTLCTT